MSRLVPTNISKEFIESVRKDMDELPEEKQERFVSTYNLSEYDAGVLCADKQIANFFEEVVKDAIFSLLQNGLLAILMHY